MGFYSPRDDQPPSNGLPPPPSRRLRPGVVILAVILGLFAAATALNALGVGEQPSTAPDPSGTAVAITLGIAAAFAAGAVWALRHARK